MAGHIEAEDKQFKHIISQGLVLADLHDLGKKLVELVLKHNASIATMQTEVSSYASESLRVEIVAAARAYREKKGELK